MLHCVVVFVLLVLLHAVNEQTAMAAVGCMATRSEIDKEMGITGPQVCTAIQ